MSSALEAGLILEKLRRLEYSRRRPYRRRYASFRRRRFGGRRRYGRRRYGRSSRRWYYKRVPAPAGSNQVVPLYARLPKAGWVYNPAENRFQRQAAARVRYNLAASPLAYTPNPLDAAMGQ